MPIFFELLCARALSLSHEFLHLCSFLLSGGKSERERAHASERARDRETVREEIVKGGDPGEREGGFSISLTHTNSPTLCAYEQISEKGLSGEEGGTMPVSTIPFGRKFA